MDDTKCNSGNAFTSLVSDFPATGIVTTEEPTAKLRWKEIIHPVGNHMATVEKVLEQYWMIRDVSTMSVRFEWREVPTE